jgi:hypothetical protein
MKRNFVWVAILCATALAATPLIAQNATAKGAKGSASAKDSNVKTTSMTNPENPKIVAPEKKGGPKSRGLGGTCDIHVDNHTPYYVQFYFNGEPAGVLGPWGDLYPNITQGNAQLYGRAVFDNGTVLTFGPEAYRCTGGNFTWTLTP